MDDAICNTAMRERHPRSGLGTVIVMIAFIAATFLVLKNLVGNLPWP